MKKKNKFLGVLLCLLPIAAAIGVQMLVSLIVMTPYTLPLQMQAMSPDGLTLDAALYTSLFAEWVAKNPKTWSLVMGISTFSAEAAMILVGGIWYRHFRKNELGIKKAMTPGSSAYHIALGLALQAVMVLFMGIVFSILPPSVLESYEALSTTLVGAQNHILMVIAVALLAPVAEEIFFRGLVLNYAKNYFGRKAGIIISGILFGLFHYANVSSAEAVPGVTVQVVYASFLGIFLAFVADKYKSIWATIFVHIGVNASAEISSIVSGALPQELGIIVSAVIIYGFGAIALVICLVLKRRMRAPEALTIAEMEQLQTE